MTAPTDPPRAAAFIVSVFGDVVVPRGGSLWTGDLVALCAAQGIGEGPVRTAVSRLAAAGRLEGVRRGRRSFHRLAGAAEAEFARAARRIYDPPPRPGGWLLTPEGAAAPDGWARVGDWAMAPDAPGTARPRAPVFAAGAASGGFAGRAAAAWGLDAIAAGYRAFLQAPCAQEGAGEGDPLGARVRLVHEFRLVLLRDPWLPADARPADWPGEAARARFAARYLALSEAADTAASGLEGLDGPLPRQSAATRRRLETLQATASE